MRRLTTPLAYGLSIIAYGLYVIAAWSHHAGETLFGGRFPQAWENCAEDALRGFIPEEYR